MYILYIIVDLLPNWEGYGSSAKSRGDHHPRQVTINKYHIFSTNLASLIFIIPLKSNQDPIQMNRRTNYH